MPILSRARLNRRSWYFKQHILTGINGSNAPRLKEITYFPFVDVPSGKMINGGNSLPEAIKRHLSEILKRISSFSPLELRSK
jgi:hypothetical protein